jgi:hypothetical protein
MSRHCHIETYTYTPVCARVYIYHHNHHVVPQLRMCGYTPSLRTSRGCGALLSIVHLSPYLFTVSWVVRYAPSAHSPIKKMFALDWPFRGLIPDMDKILFSPLEIVRTGCGSHPAFSSVRTGVLFPAVRRRRSEAERWPLYGDEVTNDWNQRRC